MKNFILNKNTVEMLNNQNICLHITNYKMYQQFIEQAKQEGYTIPLVYDADDWRTLMRQYHAMSINNPYNMLIFMVKNKSIINAQIGSAQVNTDNCFVLSVDRQEVIFGRNGKYKEEIYQILHIDNDKDAMLTTRELIKTILNTITPYSRLMDNGFAFCPATIKDCLFITGKLVRAIGSEVIQNYYDVEFAYSNMNSVCIYCYPVGNHWEWYFVEENQLLFDDTPTIPVSMISGDENYEY